MPASSRPNHAKIFARFAVMGAFALFGLVGCGDNVDPIEARLCRLAAVAVIEDQPLRIRAQSILAATATEPRGVRLELGRSALAQPRWIECRFDPASAHEAPELASLRTESEVLSEPRLFVLNRFWLRDIEAASADPLLATQAASLPALPFALAYGFQHILNALPNAAIYGLLASAFALVYGLGGRINLAFGAIAASGGAAAFLGAALVPEAPGILRLAAALLFGLWGSAIHGLVIERLAMQPLRRASGQQGLVATIGIALFLTEYLRLVQGSAPKWITAILGGPIALARAGGFTLTVTPIALILAGIAATASSAILLALNYSRFGREWRATADDPVAAAMFGVDPQGLSLKTFTAASALVGLAGASVTVYYGSLGFEYTTALGLKALIAAIVGGIGSVKGAFFGGVGIALAEALWSAYFPIVYRDFVIDALLVVMLVLRPGGLFGLPDLLPRRV